MKKVVRLLALAMLLAPLFLSAQNAKVIELNTEEFKRLVVDYTDPDGKFLGDKPTVVDFYATWCRPCRMLAPHLEELAQEYEGRLVIYKVNVDTEKPMCQAIGIKAMPTMYMFTPKGEVFITTGYREKADLKALIEEELKP